MDNAVRVGEGEPLCDLDRQLERPTHGQRPGAADELLQVLAVDVLEDDVLLPVPFAVVDDGDDVRVVEPRRRPRLAAEALDVLGVDGVLVVEDLDRDSAREPPVTRPVDAGHSPGAGQLLELVPLSEQLADHALRSLPVSPVSRTPKVARRSGEKKGPPGFEPARMNNVLRNYD